MHFDELVQNIDFTPTFLELAGVELNSVEPLDGVSLKKTLTGDKKPVHDFLFFEIGSARGVMTKDWKYIAVRYDEETEKKVQNGFVFKGWNGHDHLLPYYIVNSHLGYHAALLNQHYFEKDQLYNMKTDPTEMVNVLSSNSDTALVLKKMLNKSLKSFSNRPYSELAQDMGLNLKIPLRDVNFKIQVYPNPSTGCFYVEMPEVLQNGSYEVYSSSGLLIRDGNFTGNHIKLNLANSPKGCYYLKISNKQKSWSEKLII